ncbi:myb family transcription factor EFM [Nymphaea colorata]|nr:myb family transcription factor EFM [Nymphaea colorata]
MNPSSEFSLESKPSSCALLFKSFGDQLDKTNKLEDFLNRLEEERLKIDAFRRELPLCMQLLNDVMEASRQQLAACQLNHSSSPVLEEFIPLKHPESSDRSLTAIETSPDKTTWMTTAQLWSQANDGSKQKGSAAMESEHGLPATSKLGLDAKQRNGGAFLPFTKDKTGATQALRPLPELALAPSDKCADEPSQTESAAELAVPVSRIMSSEDVHRSNDNGGGGIGTDHKSGNEQAQTAGQTHRKPRRCWSPDLHRRFVNALQQLGGSQVATPKQIRELMKVDGLTNDEVKSHLQKYRLHTRRPSHTPQAVVAAPAHQLVVLGGIWVPQEYTTAAHAAAPNVYTTTMAAAAAVQPPPPPPSHYSHPSAMTLGYCSQLNPPPHHQLRQIYAETTKDNNNYNSGNNNNDNKTSSNSHSSIRSSTAGEGTESVEEEGKSESGSWKGENAEESRKELGRGLSLRKSRCLRSENEDDQEGEESTGSDITLKF